jgi:serine/alanine adding enzyme
MKFHWLNMEEGDALWDRALDQFSEVPFSLLYAWRKVYEKALRLKTYYLMAQEKERVIGLCPLVYIKSPWIGRGSFLISLPYMTRAGIVVSDPLTREIMIQQVITKARDLKADFVELRELAGDRFLHFPSNQEHVQMVLDLPEDWDRYEKEIAPRIRQIKKARNAGLEIRRGKGKILLADYYRVFSQRMKELIFPVYPKKYFEMILDLFHDQAELVMVYDRERPLGGMLRLAFKGVCSVPYVATLVEHHGSYANQLLYYEAIHQAWKDGIRTIDFCRSQIDSGTFTFKRQWKAIPRNLIYQYPLCKGETSVPTLGRAQGSLTFRLTSMIWPHIPLSMTQWLGGKLIRQLILA